MPRRCSPGVLPYLPRRATFRHGAYSRWAMPRLRLSETVATVPCSPKEFDDDDLKRPAWPCGGVTLKSRGAANRSAAGAAERAAAGNGPARWRQGSQGGQEAAAAASVVPRRRRLHPVRQRSWPDRGASQDSRTEQQQLAEARDHGINDMISSIAHQMLDRASPRWRPLARRLSGHSSWPGPAVEDVRGRQPGVADEFPSAARLETLPRELRPIAERLDGGVEQLQKAFAREKQAAADISHELRTPLAALMTTLEVGLRRRAAPGIPRAAGGMPIGGQHMYQLVERLLTLARLDAGADHIAPPR